MREHGTHACYVHGPDTGSGKGCRCDSCRQARAAYERERTRRAAPTLIGADRARQHVKALQGQGMGWKSIATAAGLSPSVLWKLLYGDPTRGLAPSKRIRRATEQKILTVTLGQALPAALIDSTRCRADITTLLARGWSKVAIAQAIDEDYCAAGGHAYCGDDGGRGRCYCGARDYPPRGNAKGDRPTEGADRG